MMLRRRRDQAFFRLKLFETRLKHETNRRELTRLEKLTRQEREHLKNARHELARVPVSPTHRDIAEVLDMPKGSVDSALYYMRTSLKHFTEDDIEKSISAN
jgi:DNA-directed RNA polymerase specialized sigma24 family protein